MRSSTSPASISATLMAMAIFLVLEEVVFLSSAIRHLTFKTLKDVVFGNNLFGLKFESGSGRTGEGGSLDQER